MIPSNFQGFLTLAVLTTASHGAVLVSDNFDSVGLDGNLNGRAPSFVDPSLGAVAWAARTGADANFLGNGSGGILANSGANRSFSAGLDLGSSSFFVTNPGVYELSLTVQNSSGTGSSWVGFGFGASLSTAVNQTQTASAGRPWMINRLSGQNVVFQGDGAASTLGTLTVSGGGLQTLTMRLDTTGGGPWTLSAFVNGTAIDLDNTSSGTSFTYTTNPADLRYITMSTGYNATGETVGTPNFDTIDNFTFTLVPEPSSALLGISGAAFAFLRRRR